MRCKCREPAKLPASRSVVPIRFPVNLGQYAIIDENKSRKRRSFIIKSDLSVRDTVASETCWQQAAVAFAEEVEMGAFQENGSKDAAHQSLLPVFSSNFFHFFWCVLHPMA